LQPSLVDGCHWCIAVDEMKITKKLNLKTQDNYHLNKSFTAMRQPGTAGSASAMSPRR
jgi:hypothetical protein